MSRGQRRGASSVPQSACLEAGGRDGGSPPIPNGCLRTVQSALTVATVRDRVVQMAAKLVLEPIYKSVFLPRSYGFCPKRSATMALEQLRELGKTGHHVLDADICNDLGALTM